MTLSGKHDSFNAESLNVSLTVLKSLQAEYVMRAMQAEQLLAVAMQALPENVQREITAAIMQHMQQRAKDRSVHQNAIIQATVVSIESILLLLSQTDPVNTSREQGSESQPVNNVSKAITLLRHICTELDRCLNADEEAMRIIREGKLVP